MFISVIPTSKSLGKRPYTYFVPETSASQIVVWGLLEVPLGKNLITGIVADISEETPKWILIEDIRPIHSVISTTPLLTQSMIRSIISLADRYFLLIHKALSLFLPAPLLTRLEKRHYVLGSPNSSSFLPFPLSPFPPTLHHFISRTFSPSDFEATLEHGSVYIFPDDTMLTVFLESLKKRKDILVLPHEATSSKRVTAWIDIYEWKYPIIVWTRRILYYNLARYRNIIYIEDAFGTEQYSYPIEIRSLDVLSSLFQNKEQNLTIISSSPTLELFAKFPKIPIITKK